MNADTIRPNHRIQIETEQQLESAFHDFQQGPFGAFHFSHATPHPWLAVLTNASLAYIHYFPTEGHPGFQSVADSPSATDPGETIRFLQAGGCEADGFDMPAYTTIPVDRGLAVAREFLHTPSLPTCIQWYEL